MPASLPQSNFVQGGFYHVYNRGIRKQNIFLDNKDYQRYTDRLKEYKGKHQVSIIAYCLMPNHVHLLIRQNGPQPASKFIQRLHTAYSMYFNKKYSEVGHLFQNRFKAKIISKDEYLMHLSRYIHLNPEKLLRKLPGYKWSSYGDYIGRSDTHGLVDTKFILDMFRKKKGTLEDAIFAYKDFVKVQKHDSRQIDSILFKEDSH